MRIWRWEIIVRPTLARQAEQFERECVRLRLERERAFKEGFASMERPR